MPLSMAFFSNTESAIALPNTKKHGDEFEEFHSWILVQRFFISIFLQSWLICIILYYRFQISKTWTLQTCFLFQKRTQKFILQHILAYNINESAGYGTGAGFFWHLLWAHGVIALLISSKCLNSYKRIEIEVSRIRSVTQRKLSRDREKVSKEYKNFMHAKIVQKQTVIKHRHSFQTVMYSVGQKQVW